MIKDPAFLFYSNDFIVGTQFMSNEQVGKYIRLLCAQHQHGRLSEKQILKICKQFDDEIMSKFIKDRNGKYYNKRLDVEIQKRKKFTDSRRNNALKHKKNKNTSKAYEKHMLEHMHNHMDKHMENENENENENIDINNEIDSNNVETTPRAREKEPKKVQFAEFVTMTNAEYEALVEKHGEHSVGRFIEILDNYKGSSGKKYKSDYRAILSWVVDKFSEEKSKTTTESDVSFLDLDVGDLGAGGELVEY